MQLPINSANIATFYVKVSFNVLLRQVVWDTSGTSYVGSGASLVKGISFSLIDQSGVPLETLNFTSPQIAGPITSGNWIYTTNLSNVAFHYLFHKYQIIAAIQDASGTIYQTVPVFASLCEPQNITDSGYVPGLFVILPDCINSVLTVKELTQLVYNNLQPTSVTKSGTLNSPTGSVAPLAFVTTPIQVNPVYTGQYNIQCTTVATYALGNDVYVLVSYVTNNNFPVTCQNKISDLMCCILEVQKTAIRHCDDAMGENARHQLYEILPYVVTGIGKEISGQDAWFEADYIRKYLVCNCGSASQQQSEFTPINPAVSSIVLNGVGGTTIPAPTTTGNTKTYSIASSIYQVVKGNTGDLAFTIATNTAIANTVQYLLTINYDIFAGSILNAIAADPSLINQLNSLTNELGFSAQGLNGLCIINLSQANYSLSIGVNSGTLITNVVIAGNTYNAPANLFGNNASAVAAWLNSLSLGAFTVSVSSNILTILSIGNTNVIATMTFTSPNVTQSFQVVTATLNQVLQAIFNYVCGMTSLQVALGGAVGLCSFNYSGAVVTTNYTNTQSQAAFNAGVGASICSIVARMNSLTGITCAAIQAVFADNTAAVFNNATDRYLSIVGGSCTTLTGHQQALAVIAAIQLYPDALAAFCAISCTTPATCPNISNVSFSALNPTTIGFYSVTWGITPSANQIVTLLYRVAGTTPWQTASSGINITPAGTISGTTPFQISGLTPGTVYQVSVGNNCGGTPFIANVTVPPNTTFNGPFRLDNVIYNICGDAPTLLYSAAPFATGVTMFTDPGLTMPVTGFNLIATNAGEIYNLNSSTGVVGSDTLSNCGTGTPGIYLLANGSAVAACTGLSKTLYTNGAFAVGSTLYTDQSLTNPQTGYAFVANSANSNVYNLNTSTGQVGSLTGTSCTSIGNTVQLATTVNQICQAGNTTAYTNGAFATGKILYSDSGLTTPITGYLFVVYSNNLYNLNSTTGVIGSTTSQTCSDTFINNGSSWATVTNVNLVTGFTLTGTVAPGASQNGTHGAFTNTIQITVTGTLSGSTKAQLIKNSTELSCVAITGAGTYTFPNATFNIGDGLLVRLGGGTCP